MLRALLAAGLLAGGAAPWTDSYGDGTPDFLRLASRSDQEAFRGWFRFVAEAQSFREHAANPREIVDCSALLRFAYRESLRAHDGAWLRAQGVEIAPPIGDVQAVRYPHTPLGAALFRVRPGPLAADNFGQFADAQTLLRMNAHLISRDLAAAQPGDLLFYRQLDDSLPFHSMIYLGPSWFAAGPELYVVYHTGPRRGQPGEVRRVTITELLRHPEPRWRPVPGNPNFLGVYRWNILRDAS
jgi:uncharacterized protein